MDKDTKDEFGKMHKEFEKIHTEFDKVNKKFAKIDNRLDGIEGNMVTKEELARQIAPLATKRHVDDAVEELARIIAETVASPLQRHLDEVKQGKVRW